MKRVAVKIEAVAEENENSGVQEYCMLLTVFFFFSAVYLTDRHDINIK